MTRRSYSLISPVTVGLLAGLGLSGVNSMGSSRPTRSRPRHHLNSRQLPILRTRHNRPRCRLLQEPS